MEVLCKNPACNRRSSFNRKTIFCSYCGRNYKEFGIDVASVADAFDAASTYQWMLEGKYWIWGVLWFAVALFGTNGPLVWFGFVEIAILLVYLELFVFLFVMLRIQKRVALRTKDRFPEYYNQ